MNGQLKNWRRAGVSALVLGAILGLVGLGVILEFRSIKNAVTDEAFAAASQWADTFIIQEDKIETVLSGRPLSEPEKEFFEKVSHVGNVFRYKIFDANGTLRLVSDALDETGTESLQDHRPDIAAILLEGGRHLEMGDGRRKTNRPDDYAEAYVPINRDGEIVGLVEVYVDVTEKAALMWEQMYVGLAITLGLAAVAVLHGAYTGYLIHRARRAHTKIDELAHNDMLTSLPNRAHFQAAVEQRILGAEEAEKRVALIFIDLDRFKEVNDLLGHQAGDRLLRQVGNEIRSCLQVGELPARIGGDEFAVAVNVSDDPQRPLDLATAIVEAISDISDIEGIPASIGASLGIALAPEHATTLIDLQKCADVALYKSKSAGRGRWTLYEPGMDEALRVRNLLRMRLRSALDDGTFELYFQPLHSAQKNSLVSFEALLRLPDGEGAYISPADFIPVAEAMGLTPRLGAWVLEEACRAAADWPSDLSISVNLSPQQFDENVVEVVRKALANSGLAPNRLELEVTEGLLIRDPARVGRQLHELKALGAKIAMDDFGTGYSSLSYLWQFPFDKVKVDRSCFSSLEESESVREVLRTVVAMGDAMDLKITAEGIETEAQRTFAREAGYAELQGYLFHRPMPGTNTALYIQQCRIAALEEEAMVQAA